MGRAHGVPEASEGKGQSRRLTVVMLAVVGLGAAAGGILLLGGASRAPASTQPGGGRPSDTTDARVMSFDVTTVAAGSFVALKQAELRNELGIQTTLKKILPEGSAVKAGEVVAELDVKQLSDKLSEAEMAITTARTELSSAENALEIQRVENESALRKAQVTVELADLDLNKWVKGEVESRRQTLQVAIQEAQTKLDRSRKKFEQSKPLFEKGFISESEYQADRIELDAAELSVETARLNRRLFDDFEEPKERRKRQSDLEQAQGELRAVDRRNANQLATKEVELANRRQQVQLREAAMKELRDQLDKAVMKAPSDGLVVHGSTLQRWWDDSGAFREGSNIRPSQLVVAISDVSSMKVVAKVHESLQGRVKVGQVVSVTVPSLDGRSFPGKVSSVAPMATQDGWSDDAKVFEVSILLDVKTDVFKPAQRAEAHITLDHVPGALSVPIQAVGSDGPVRYVLVPSQQERGRFERRPVKVGRRSERFAEILGGLATGDAVLLRQPEPREVRAQPFSPEQLAAVGLKFGDRGEIVPVAVPEPEAPTTVQVSGVVPQPAPGAAGDSGGAPPAPGPGGTPD
jgi:HlyD family secretion protein